MSPTLVALVLLTALLGFRLYSRYAPPRPRPIFEQNHIFAGRLTEGLLHALIADQGFMRVDTRVSGFEGQAVVVDRDGACGRLVLYPALGFGRDTDLLGVRTVAARHAGERSTTLVVIGGGEEFSRRALEAAAPLRAMHVGDDGRLREVRRGFKKAAPRQVVEGALDRMVRDLGDGAFPTIDLGVARSLVTSSDEESARSAPGAFRGVVTTALTVAIVLCFAIEVAISRDSLWGDRKSVV